MGRMRKGLKKLISGGQTGVDRAALDAALEAGYSIGGYCPKGRLAEDGSIPGHYPLEETGTRAYSVRTRMNVLAGDATLILSLGAMLTGGTALTAKEGKAAGKPLFAVDLSKRNNSAKKVLQWLEDNEVRVLNVAGPRESSAPGVYLLAKKFLSKILEAPSLARKPRNKKTCGAG